MVNLDSSVNMRGKVAAYLTAREAADELGVLPQTLYAYVSRGLIRSEDPGPGKRGKRYHAEDVHRLKERKRARHDPDSAAAHSLRWGPPVLESGITRVDDGAIHYRDRDVATLARTHTIEQVATLLWTGDPTVPGDWFTDTAPEPVRDRKLCMLSAFQVDLARAEAENPSAWDMRPRKAARTASLIMRRLAVAAASGDRAECAIAELLANALTPRRPKSARLFDAVLILMADHELNVASFTARCVASAGATPYMAVSAGIAAMQGVRHARHLERVEAFLANIESPRHAAGAVEARLRRGEHVPGWGHRLHPSGDPRATELFRLLDEYGISGPAAEIGRASSRAVLELLGEHPTIEVPLYALEKDLELPNGSALMLYAIGRSAGLLAHAIEQYEAGTAIRPRARYVAAVGSGRQEA